ANLIDSHGCDVGQQTTAKRGLAGRILSEAGRHDISHDDFIDLLWRQTSALYGSFHNDRAELRCGHRFQATLELPNRSAHRTDDYGILHGGSPDSRYHNRKPGGAAGKFPAAPPCVFFFVVSIES